MKKIIILLFLIVICFKYSSIKQINLFHIKEILSNNYFNFEKIDDEIQLKPIKLLYSTSAKTYMDYRQITDPTSLQFQLINSEKIYIDKYGYLRDEEGFIGVAMGSYFGEIGSKYICHLDNGKQIKVIKVESKNDIHTISNFCGYLAYDIIEFVIDSQTEWMKNNIWSNGYIFNGDFNNCENFSGKIIKIEKILT